MLEKTKIFLKKEIGKQAGPNEDSYIAFWKEKAEISWVILKECYIHLGAFGAGRNSKCTRELLKFLQANNRDMETGSDRELDLRQWSVGLKNDADYIRRLKLFFKPNYEPPTDLIELLDHIVVIYLYYHDLLPSIDIPSWTTDAKIDLALLKLTRDISAEIDSLDLMITTRDHIMPAALAKREKCTQQKEAIKHLLESFDIKKDLTCFRHNKCFRKKFMEEAVSQTGLIDGKIMKFAREILKKQNI